MFRSYSAACFAAAFGAVVILPIHARCLEAQLPLSALVAVGFVAAIAASAWFIIMAMWDGIIPFAGGAWRSTLAAFLAAAYGAVTIGSVYDRCLDAMVPAPEALAITFTAWSAAIACLLIMLCRSPVEVVEYQFIYPDASPPGYVHVPGRAVPPAAGSGVRPPTIEMLKARKLEAEARLAEARALQAEADLRYSA